MGEVGEEVIQVSDVVSPSRYTSSSPIVASASKNSVHSHSSLCFSDHLAKSVRISPINIEEGLVDMGLNTKPSNPQDWLPITSSTNGNAYYSAFHTLNSGIGFQALLLPIAFTALGLTWGIICLVLMFLWQFYTIWLLMQLHESIPGTRYNRYIQLSKAAFGEKLGKLLALFPIMYLSGGTCVMLIITAGDNMKIFMKIVCEPTRKSLPLTTIECYLLFICLAITLALLLPNLNSVAWISFIGAIVAVSYCTLLWVISISKDRPTETSDDPAESNSELGRAFSVLNAFGIIAFAFRGHNLILEIQATMPSDKKKPSRVPMARGVNFAYVLIALCLFPLAIGGYWAYGDKVPIHGGILSALHTYHRHDTSKFALILTSILVLIHCLTSFQIYAMPAIDNLEFAYIINTNKPCSKLIRSAVRVLFGCITFLVAVAIPFIRDLAGIVGGIALPVTLAYPCFMWIAIKKPRRCSAMWVTNFVLGSIGIVLSVLVLTGGIWSLVHPGIYVRFFKP